MFGRGAIIGIICICSYGFAYSQSYNATAGFLKMNANWVFGDNGGLDFNAGVPAPVSFLSSLASEEACAAVSDSSTGQLLCYLGSHGTIRNRNHVPMQNGTGLIPYTTTRDGSSSAQGAVIVPVIDTPWKYYVFINTSYEAYGVFFGPATISPAAAPPYLTYSVIDMTLDNGLGAVEPGRKNIPLYSYGLHESMIAVPGNACDVWLITVAAAGWPNVGKDPRLPQGPLHMLAWHITDQGIDPDPVASTPDPVGVRADITWSANTMAISPDRQSLALGMTGGLLLSRFDPGTGKVSAGMPLRTGRTMYGVCFSPDNSKLYATALFRSLLQYDVSVYDSASVMASEYTVSNSGWESALRLYNGVIYTTPYTYPSIRAILNPNAAGPGCNFRANIASLSAGSRARLGLPTEVVFPVVHHESAVIHDSICYSAKTGYAAKTLSAPENFVRYEWDDGSTGRGREISAPGVYWVQYRNKACLKHTDTFYIAAIDLSFSLGDDKTLLFCDHPQSYVQLRADLPPERFRFRWQDGSTGNSFRATTPGRYWVEVSRGGCAYSDTVQISDVVLDVADTLLCMEDGVDLIYRAPELPAGVLIQWSTGATTPSLHITDTGQYWVRLVAPPCVLTDSFRISTEACVIIPPPFVPYRPELYIPNAFSPNGDGRNDVFRIRNIREERLETFRIMNRYGQPVFETADPRKGWDGIYEGVPAEGGVYFYFCRLRLPDGTEVVYKGDLTLIR